MGNFSSDYDNKRKELLEPYGPGGWSLAKTASKGITVRIRRGDRVDVFENVRDGQTLTLPSLPRSAYGKTGPEARARQELVDALRLYGRMLDGD